MSGAAAMSSIGTGVAGLMAIVAVAVSTAGVSGQADLKPLIQNERVTVWDVPAGSPAPSLSSTRDVVALAIHDTAADVTFRARGSNAKLGQLHDRTILIELQDKTVPPLVNKSGYADAFPRPGSKRVLDSPRVVAWDYTWTPGQPTPMHFHDKDVVVTYLADGELTSTDPKGERVVNPHSFGFTKFNPRDRVHTETLTKGQGRAIIVELK
jgi:hypothetical protein